MDGLLSRDVLYRRRDGTPRIALSASRVKLRYPVSRRNLADDARSSFSAELPDDQQLIPELVASLRATDSPIAYGCRDLGNTLQKHNAFGSVVATDEPRHEGHRGRLRDAL
jgi:hypothetical protein